MSDKLEVGDTVKLTDYKSLREGSVRGRELYMKLAHPDAKYVIEHITALNEVYVHGVTNYLNYNLLEKC